MLIFYISWICVFDILFVLKWFIIISWVLGLLNIYSNCKSIICFICFNKCIDYEFVNSSLSGIDFYLLFIDRCVFLNVRYLFDLFDKD